jgi:hypothetical protein
VGEDLEPLSPNIVSGLLLNKIKKIIKDNKNEG